MSGQREYMDGRRGQLQEAGAAGPQVGSRVWDLLFLKNLRGLGKRFINEFYVPSFAETDDVRHWIRHAIPFEEADLDAAEEAADRICGWLEGHPEVQAVTVFDPLFPERLKELVFWENAQRFYGKIEKNFTHISPTSDDADGWTIHSAY